MHGVDGILWGRSSTTLSPAVDLSGSQFFLMFESGEQPQLPICVDCQGHCIQSMINHISPQTGSCPLRRQLHDLQSISGFTRLKWSPLKIDQLSVWRLNHCDKKQAIQAACSCFIERSFHSVQRAWACCSLLELPVWQKIVGHRQKPDNFWYCIQGRGIPLCNWNSTLSLPSSVNRG